MAGTGPAAMWVVIHSTSTPVPTTMDVIAAASGKYPPSGTDHTRPRRRWARRTAKYAASRTRPATPVAAQEMSAARALVPGTKVGSWQDAGWRFVVSLLQDPLWLAGWAALAGGFIFQALALHAGQMSVVQPLLVTELVFALALRRGWLHQPIRSATWWAAVVTCFSLAVFLGTSEPQGGTPYPDSRAWATGAWGTVGAAAALASLACAAPRSAGRR